MFILEYKMVLVLDNLGWNKFKFKLKIITKTFFPH